MDTSKMISAPVFIERQDTKEKTIQMARVEFASRLADTIDFIEKEAPNLKETS